MGKAGFFIAEEGHVVQLLSPDAYVAATSSAVISMKNWGHIDILVLGGAGSACTFQVEECTGAGGTGAATMAFRYAQETEASDTMGAVTWAGTAGIALGTTDLEFIVIAIDNDELTDGYPYLRIKHDTVGGRDMAAVAVLSGGRYAGSQSATVLA